MRNMSLPPLTWLYVPADRPDRVEKAIASRAHAVIVDLEDGVAAPDKERARANVVDLLGQRRDKPVFVRINAGSAADLELVAELELAGVVVPKVERPEDIPPDLHVHALIESPLGLEAAYLIACQPQVHWISLGEEDLRSLTGAHEVGLDWARGRLVNAAVAAGLPRPPQAIYPHVRDLERSCRRGRVLGHFGRAAIHPDQLAVIEDAYLPTRAEVELAQATVERLESGAVGTLADGTFVDAAMLGAAQQIIEIAARYGTSGSPNG